MAGNVSEWVADWHRVYESSSVNNTAGSSSGDYRILWGGSWYNDDLNICSANRGAYSPDNWHYIIGFRCVSRTASA